MLSKHDSIGQIMQQNHMMAAAYSHYLNHTPRLIDAEMVNSLAADCHVSTAEAFLSLLSAACGLDTEIPLHRALEHQYVRAGLRELDPTPYASDAYCQSIRFPTCKNGKWELKQDRYAAYEPFVWNHPVLTEELREIPQIGYFQKDFSFPAILENGTVWMTVTPNEIETMRAPIAHSRGRVLTLGLGLGYFAFHASQKPDVEEVTVVERDSEVIALFRSLILPQFPNAEKIKIIEGDALTFLESVSPTSYDFIFADLWHDPSDGLPLYLRLRRTEEQRGLRGVEYWIEPSILSHLRHILFGRLTERSLPIDLQRIPLKELLSDTFLRMLALTASLD